MKGEVWRLEAEIEIGLFLVGCSLRRLAAMRKGGFDASKHPRGKGGRFVQTSRTLYEGKKGRVVAKYLAKSREEADNLEIAKVFADLGKNVVLLPPSNTAKTPDAKIGGEEWEFKTNRVATKSAIDGLLRKAGKQAKNVALNLKSGIENSEVKIAIKQRLPRTKIERLVLIKNGKILQDLKK